jgi:toxin secretion/phage lysis holin
MKVRILDMELTQNAGTKTLIGLMSAVFMYYWNCFTEVMVILFVVLILDYVTGIIQGLLNGGFSWEKAWKGIVKKLMYGVVLIIALSVDFIIKYMTDSLGVDWGLSGMVGISVCIYLIGTEGFSILQNLLLIGVPAPDFLQKIFGLMRDNAGKLVKMPKSGDGE